MEENIDSKLAKLMRYASKEWNLESPKSYDKDKIVDIANYICQKQLLYTKDGFVIYANKLHFPKQAIDFFLDQIDKAMKRKSHHIKVINPEYILSLDI